MKKLVFGTLLLAAITVWAQATANCPMDGVPSRLVNKVNQGLTATCTYEHQYWDTQSNSWKTHSFTQMCDGTT